MVYAIWAYPYALESGLGTVFKRAASFPVFLATTVFTLAVAFLLMWWVNVTYYSPDVIIPPVTYSPGPWVWKGAYYLVTAGIVVIAAWLVTVLWAGHLRRKFAGLTGDSYGAVNEVAELVVLATVAVLAFNGWFRILF